ncbi:hypothetical protein A5686_24945 [Mycobacterium sp. E2479]|nr:hypothetical protein A5686_24945 [Mycobacterium sp. E2479]
MTTATPASEVVPFGRAFETGAVASRSALAGHPKSGPDRWCELPEYPELSTGRLGAAPCECGVVERTRVRAGDKIRAQIKMREYTLDSSAHPADGGRVSTL